MQRLRNVLAIIALTVLCAACTGITPRKDFTTMSYLALGDSYTIGEGVPEHGRWPVQFAAALRAGGIPVDEPRIIARTGWTTDELSAAMDEAEPLGQYDLVSLAIGVNNQYRGREVGEYREQFAGLLDRAIGLAGGRTDRVFVLSIPDWGVTPFAREQGRDPALIAEQLDAYNAAAAEESQRRGVLFVDVTEASRYRGADPMMLAKDGLHPSLTMYSLWSARAFHAVGPQLVEAR